MITMTRPQANAIGQLIAKYSAKATSINIEQVTGEILKGAVAISFKGGSKATDRSYLVGQNGVFVTG